MNASWNSGSVNPEVSEWTINPEFEIWFQKNFPWKKMKVVGDDSEKIPSITTVIWDNYEIDLDFYLWKPWIEILYMWRYHLNEHGGDTWSEASVGREELPTEYREIWKTNRQKELLASMPRIYLGGDDKKETEYKAKVLNVKWNINRALLQKKGINPDKLVTELHKVTKK